MQRDVTLCNGGGAWGADCGSRPPARRASATDAVCRRRRGAEAANGDSAFDALAIKCRADRKRLRMIIGQAFLRPLSSREVRLVALSRRLAKTEGPDLLLVGANVKWGTVVKIEGHAPPPSQRRAMVRGPNCFAR